MCLLLREFVTVILYPCFTTLESVFVAVVFFPLFYHFGKGWEYLQHAMTD